jgi:hypothetical protein
VEPEYTVVGRVPELEVRVLLREQAVTAATPAADHELAESIRGRPAVGILLRVPLVVVFVPVQDDVGSGRVEVLEERLGPRWCRLPVDGPRVEVSKSSSRSCISPSSVRRSLSTWAKRSWILPMVSSFWRPIRARASSWSSSPMRSSKRSASSCARATASISSWAFGPRSCCTASTAVSSLVPRSGNRSAASSDHFQLNERG